VGKIEYDAMIYRPAHWYSIDFGTGVCQDPAA